MPEYISIADFASRAGIAKQTVYQRIEKDLKPFVKLIGGRKAIDTSALTLFNTMDSTDSANRIEQEKPKESTDSRDKLIETLENYVNTLNNQLAENNETTRREQESNKTLQEENNKLTDQITKLSNDFAELASQSQTLASQAQSLQGHMQQQTLGTSNVDAFTAVDSVDKTEIKPDEKEEKVDCVDQTRKRGLFSRLFR